MYHVTNASNLDSILKNGLIPQIGDRSGMLGETTPAVSAFPTVKDCHTALSQWLGQWWCDWEDSQGVEVSLVIIEFDASELTVLPQECPWEVHLNCVVPPSAIRALYSESTFGSKCYTALMAEVA